MSAGPLRRSRRGKMKHFQIILDPHGKRIGVRSGSWMDRASGHSVVFAQSAEDAMLKAGMGHLIEKANAAPNR